MVGASKVNTVRVSATRLFIRVGGQLEVPHRFYTLEAYARDKWAVDERLTLSLGARYDLEVFPLENPTTRTSTGWIGATRST